ncbi:2182_t:CDS:2 [Entrophospora sp. SA101]|nr:2182_t:CDS:2 [Entrophospora sp. SA101]CAJ0842200.1 11225_t:CDS:2 [Entrophospora sp. SA101]
MLEILLCRKRRETEPISIVICKRFTVILFVLITSVVLIILSIGAYNDLPTIKRVYSSATQIPAPVIYMQSAWQFEIACSIFFTKIDNEEGTIDDKYIIQPTKPTIPDENNSTYWRGSISPTNLSFISDINKAENQAAITELNLMFTITDPNYNEANNGSVRFNIYIHDQEYDPLNDPFVNESDNYSNFVKSLRRKSFYSTGNRYSLEISRKQRSLLQDSPLNNLGLSVRYPSRNYIVTDDHLVGRMANSSYAILHIVPQTFLLETEVEQRNKNALTVISNVLAVWGGLSSFYIFLFGANSIKPWGFIQENIFKSEIRYKLGLAPFSKNEGNPEERIDALETFLKNHVVDVDVSLIGQSNKSSDKSPLITTARTVCKDEGNNI